jgi:hypothetical protein
VQVIIHGVNRVGRKEGFRLTRSRYRFSNLVNDYQNPGASGQHLSRVSQKRERTEGGVLFQDGEDPQLGAPRNHRR